MMRCVLIHSQSVRVWTLSLLTLGCVMGITSAAWSADAPAQTPTTTTAPPAPSSGAQKPPAKNIRQVCPPDVKKFCSGVKPGGGRIIQCLDSHAPELSDDCRAAVAQEKGGMP